MYIIDFNSYNVVVDDYDDVMLFCFETMANQRRLRVYRQTAILSVLIAGEFDNMVTLRCPLSCNDRKRLTVNVQQ